MEEYLVRRYKYSLATGEMVPLIEQGYEPIFMNSPGDGRVTVMFRLKKKAGRPKKVKAETVLQGPFDDVPDVPVLPDPPEPSVQIDEPELPTIG